MLHLIMAINGGLIAKGERREEERRQSTDEERERQVCFHFLLLNHL